MNSSSRLNKLNIENIRNSDSDKLNNKIKKEYTSFAKLTSGLLEKNLSSEVLEFANTEINLLNTFIIFDKKLLKALRKSKNKLIEFIVSNSEFVPKDYYRQRWMVYGIMIGSVIGASSSSFPGDNSTIASAAMPIIMVIGMGLGAEKDKRIILDGKQLDY